MGKGDILNEISSLRKEISALDKKIDRLSKRTESIEKKVEKLSAMEELLETFPAKLNTTSYQIISNFEEKTNEIGKNLEESIDKNLQKMDKLVDIDKRLDDFEEYLKAHVAKIRAMLLELEDSIRR